MFLLAMVSLGNDEKLMDRALSDFRDNSFFVSVTIEVKSSNTTKQYIVENDDLYRFLKRYEELNTKTYVSYMKKKMVGHKVLKLKELNSDFVEVVNLNNVNENAKKGKDHFFTTYFTESGVIKKGIDEKEKFAIIQKLFEFNVLSSMDDESGYLCIDRELFIK